MSNLSSAVLTPQNTLRAPLRVLPATTLLPHHQAPFIPLSLFPYTFCLLKSSFLKRSLPSTREMKKKEDSEECRLKAKEDAEDAAIAAFMDAPFSCRRRCRPSQLGSKSSALELSDSKESDSSDGFDLGDDEGEEEEEEEEDDEDQEEMEYRAPDYPQEDFRDDLNAYAPRSP